MCIQDATNVLTVGNFGPVLAKKAQIIARIVTNDKIKRMINSSNALILFIFIMIFKYR